MLGPGVTEVKETDLMPALMQLTALWVVWSSEEEKKAAECWL